MAQGKGDDTRGEDEAILRRWRGEKAVDVGDVKAVAEVNQNGK